MTQVKFAPHHKVTVVTDNTHSMLLFASKGCWVYDTVINQIHNGDTTTITGEEKINDINLIATAIKGSDFLMLLISKLITSDLKFYVNVNLLGYIDIGVRMNNSIIWFSFLGKNNLIFDHIFNQNTGKTVKSLKQGFEKQQLIEKKIGIKFSMLTQN